LSDGVIKLLGRLYDVIPDLIIIDRIKLRPEAVFENATLTVKTVSLVIESIVRSVSPLTVILSPT